MRLSVLSAPLILVSTTLAHAPLRRGVTTDTCANLDTHLVFPDVTVDNKPYDAGRIRIDLCISQVDKIADHYDVTQAAAKVVGMGKVKSAVIALIKQTGTQCSYPLHAMPAPTPSDECDFMCTDGFMAVPQNNPSSCVCSGENCTATAPPLRRSSTPKCAEGLVMCGVPDRTGQLFKCTNITSDPSTCGGCVKASPFDSLPAGGVDCNKIPHVGEVSCLGGKCIVRSCEGGFTVSASNDGCVLPKVTRNTATAHEALSDKTVPGAVLGEKAPRTNVAAIAEELPPAGKAAVSGVRSHVDKDIPKGKVPRGFAPVTDHCASGLTGGTDREGVQLAHGLDE